MSRTYTKITSVVLVFLILFAIPKTTSAWGPKGHALVGQIAMQFVKPEVKQNVLKVLGSMSIDTAANWMDIMRSNSDYDFMKPWHYIDFAKEQAYQNTNEENIVNRIILTYSELKHKKTLGPDQIRTDLLVLMHLVGDIHQPLHTGYDDDLGGNKRAVQFNDLKTNLHKFWDEDLIDKANITLESCLDFYKTYPGGFADTINTINPALWMKESRSLLDKVYDFPDFTLNDRYLNSNSSLVKRQLLLAGLRLAMLMDKTFFNETVTRDPKEMMLKYNDGIEAKDAMQHVGKKVTVCSRVYGIKTTDKVTFINLGAKYPNSPVTVVIQAKDRPGFKSSIEDLYNDKNVCVKGTVTSFNGKTEIVVTRPEDIIVQ